MLREDWTFLRRQLDRVPIKDRAKVEAEYKRQFMKAHDTEPISYRKANAGRRAANLWLLNRFGAVSNERAWIPLPVTQADIKEAKRRHAALGGGGHDIAAYAQWEGFLGEIVFDRWLAGQGIEYVWLNRDGDQGKKWEFELHGTRVDIKTTGRQHRPKQYWTVGVAKHQAKATERHYFFSIYQRDPGDTLWLIGGIPSELFMNVARFDEEGDEIHESFSVRETGSMYNVSIMVPFPWAIWLEMINGKTQPGEP